MSDDDEAFLRSVRYFYEEKGDVTRYCYWDEARFKRLRPAAHAAWRNFANAEMICVKMMADIEYSG